ncbi:cold shock and DUF1294 domain-containing protein [Thalassotalea fonticola]|uniref:Cold shock and DUF1294 domain-containing protein n=1 Tax=Thalassotalea fonticola TaxID=3065649 RepID=A0ABZ0GQH2_9GAMM|nr:cold shock and DUF1294 domain-containing protein [Colwelliaceae bacterium S1-1]
MRVKGTLTKWDDDKGFGFIKPLTPGKDVFVHINSFQTKSKRPILNQLVTYTLIKDQQGRLCAQQATHAGERLNKLTEKYSKPRRKSKNETSMGISLYVVCLFLTTLAWLVLSGKVSFHFFAGYVLLSLVTVMFYGWDKRSAQTGRWRIPESTLHLLALIGGWPGAVWAQQRFRHKSKKLSFRIQLWLMIFTNISAFSWFFIPQTSDFIKSMF